MTHARRRRGAKNKTNTAPPPAPAPAYPPGHFVGPALRWFGADWRPRWPDLVPPPARGAAACNATLAVREQRVAEGTGWGAGTVLMRGTPTHARPRWMAAFRFEGQR